MVTLHRQAVPPLLEVSSRAASVQRISASQSLGFKDLVLESSEWLSAAILVSYCPSRSSELDEIAIT